MGVKSVLDSRIRSSEKKMNGLEKIRIKAGKTPVESAYMEKEPSVSH
ncbi:MAG: hypothetical protein JSW70_10025 [Syntrophobacterales bacterium]|nr:MAG: hypothetical protein JSW70_10025 [Syntrophobacterales bacterium]